MVQRETGWDPITKTYKFGKLGAWYIIFSVVFTTACLLVFVIRGAVS